MYNAKQFNEPESEILKNAKFVEASFMEAIHKLSNVEEESMRKLISKKEKAPLDFNLNNTEEQFVEIEEDVVEATKYVTGFIHDIHPMSSRNSSLSQDEVNDDNVNGSSYHRRRLRRWKDR